MKRIVLGALALWISVATVAACEDAVPPVPVDRKPKITGRLQIDYRQAGRVAEVSAPIHEFAVRRMRLGVDGALTPKLSYKVVLRHDGVAGTAVDVLDVYVDAKLTPWMTLRAGQHKYPFDVEGYEPDYAGAVVDRSFVTNAVAGAMNGRSTASRTASVHRDRGLTLLGKLPVLSRRISYGLGVYQGAGLATDNNDGFGVVGSLRAEPLAGLTLAAGGMHAATQDVRQPAASYGAWTAGAWWERGRWLVRAEGYAGRRESLAGKQDVRGAYALVAVTVMQDVDVAVRYQCLADERFGTAGNDLRGFETSVRYYLVREQARSGTHVSLTYLWRGAGDSFTEGATLLNDGRGAALTTGAAVRPVVVARLQLLF
jgi:hypothetical protein